MIDEGFERSNADPSLYQKKIPVGPVLHYIRSNIHVDDGWNGFSDRKSYEEFRARVQKEFSIGDSDDRNVFLGVVCDRLKDGAIKLHQKRYSLDLIARFAPDGDLKTAETPYIMSLKLTKAMGPETAEAAMEMKNYPYRSLIGALMHLANYTRPDIAAAVGICAQFCSNPGKEHWRAAIRILAYLQGTADYGVIYGRDIKKEQGSHVPYVPLVGYSDASWADQPERVSRTGNMLWSWGGPIEWRSTRQKTQALSTCEAEFMAAHECVRSVVWGRRLFEEFGYSDLGVFDPTAPPTEEELAGHKPSVVYEDNSGCIEWSKNPVAHHKRKHMDLRFFWLNAKVTEGMVKLVYCPTDVMIADLLTKYLACPRFKMLRDMMVGRE